MNPFWPPAGAPALQYGAKAINMNVVPSTDLHAGRGGGNSVEKGQGLAIFPGSTGKDKNSQAVNTVDSTQRKQILLQQALPPGARSSILVRPLSFNIIYNLQFVHGFYFLNAVLSLNFSTGPLSSSQ